MNGWKFTPLLKNTPMVANALGRTWHAPLYYNAHWGCAAGNKTYPGSMTYFPETLWKVSLGENFQRLDLTRFSQPGYRLSLQATCSCQIGSVRDYFALLEIRGGDLAKKLLSPCRPVGLSGPARPRILQFLLPEVS